MGNFAENLNLGNRFRPPPPPPIQTPVCLGVFNEWETEKGEILNIKE